MSRCYTRPSYKDNAWEIHGQGDSDAVRAVVGGPHLYNRGVLFASLDELVECEFGVFITIHITENLVHPLFTRDRMISWGLAGGRSRKRTFSGVSSSSGRLTIDPVIL